MCCGWADEPTERCHIRARSDGGSDSIENLHLLCHTCHSLTESMPNEGRYWRMFGYVHDARKKLSLPQLPRLTPRIEEPVAWEVAGVEARSDERPRVGASGCQLVGDVRVVVDQWAEHGVALGVNVVRKSMQARIAPQTVTTRYVMFIPQVEL